MTLSPSSGCSSIASLAQHRRTRRAPSRFASNRRTTPEPLPGRSGRRLVAVFSHQEGREHFDGPLVEGSVVDHDLRRRLLEWFDRVGYDADIAKTVPGDLLEKVPQFPADAKIATRKAGSDVLQPLADLGWLLMFWVEAGESAVGALPMI
jgi:hypothetical protein